MRLLSALPLAAIVSAAGLGTLIHREPAHTAAASPAAGHTIHGTAPHISQGREPMSVHHWCKVMTQDPIIVCLLYDSPDSTSPLHGVEYIVAKKLTRTAVPLGTWNSNFHDHAVEIASGRVKVLDVPPDQAKKVADLVATTDGIIFHLWPDGDAFPTGTVVIDQAVGHRAMTREELKRSAASTPQ